MAQSFLAEPAMTPQNQAIYDQDMADDGYVWNSTRVHAYQPDTMRRIAELAGEAFEPSGLGRRQRTILVLAAASTFGDSYCSLCWGANLVRDSETDVAVAVLSGNDAGLTEQEVAMVSWARQVAKDPNSTSSADVQRLRDVGLSDTQIFAITAFVSLRLAVSTVNDALGVHPDRKLAESLPPEVVAAVSYGRAPKD